MIKIHVSPKQKQKKNKMITKMLLSGRCKHAMSRIEDQNVIPQIIFDTSKRISYQNIEMPNSSMELSLMERTTSNVELIKSMILSTTDMLSYSFWQNFAFIYHSIEVLCKLLWYNSKPTTNLFAIKFVILNRIRMAGIKISISNCVWQALNLRDKLLVVQKLRANLFKTD